MSSDFRLESFKHPLSQVPYFTSEYRSVIFQEAPDFFHAGLEEYWLGKDCWWLKQWKRDSDKANGKWYDFDVSMALGWLIPIEAEILLRRRGDSAEAAHVRSLVQKALQSGRPTCYGCYPGSMYYLFTGQFVEGIDAAKEELSNLERGEGELNRFFYETGRQHEVKKVLLGTISRCYEALGEFGTAIDWKKRQVETENGELPHYEWDRGLARLYLKLGQFAQAGEALMAQYKKEAKGHGLTYWFGSSGNELVTAHLYALGGKSETCMEIVSKRMTTYSDDVKALENSGIAATLEYKGFFDEAAKIYDHLALMEKGHGAAKAEANAHAPGEPQVSEAATEEVLLCACGEILQPHWKLCPSCGKPVELACPCGEPLKAGWKLCPACGKKVSE